MDGLGESVAGMVCRKRLRIQEFVAVNDAFGESAISAELMKKYGIDSGAVIKALREL